MEAVAALSLGCNVIQLVGTAVKTGQLIYEIYQKGQLEDKDQLKERLAQLEELSRLPKKLADQPSLNSPQSEERSNLLQILQLCAKDAQILHKELRSLSVSGGRYQRLKFGIKAAVRNVPTKIQAARDRLDENQRLLDSAVTQISAADVQQLIRRQQISFEKLDQASQTILQKIDRGFTRLEAVQQQSEANVVSHIDQKFLSQAKEQQQSTNRARFEQELEISRKQLLESLMFNDMYERVKLIPRGSEDTFEWILDPHHDGLKHNFAKWLGNNEPLYWIQGLAGSGKSTLMKKIWGDDQTPVLAAKNNTFPASQVLKHSFWLPSPEPLRKNFRGMLCCLLHSLLSGSSPAINSLLEKNVNIKTFKTWSDWSERDLQTTLFNLLADRSLFNYNCIFLDALDEIELPTDQRKVLRFIQELSAFDRFHTKICVSSRPESPWTTAFSARPQLRLQHLTEADIKKYAAEMLWNELPLDEYGSGESVEEFLCEFVERSQGVFLWAHLAINILLRAPAHSSWTEMHDRLQRLPHEMEDLYEQILARRAYDTNDEKSEAATYLSLCMEPSYAYTGKWSIPREGFFLHQALPVWKKYLGKNLDYQHQCDHKTFYADYRRLEKRILDICACLLTARYGNSIQTYPFRSNGYMLSDTDYDDWLPVRPPDSELDLAMVNFTFAHRTAADFLTDTPGGRRFMQHCPLTPVDLLMAGVDAEMLRWRLWHDTAQIYRTAGIYTLGWILKMIVCFAKSNSGTVNDIQVCRAIQRIKDTFAKLPVFHTREAGVARSDAVSAYVFDLAKNSAPPSKSHYELIACDLGGLLLEVGADAWYNLCDSDTTKSDASRSQSFTTTYKNYLLICAIKGSLPKVAQHLVQNGADLYAEQYLPIQDPKVRSAIGQILVVVSDASGRYSNNPFNVTAWASLLSSCTYKTQCLPFRMVLSSHREHGITIAALTPVMHPFRSERALDVGMIFDVRLHLNLWLRHAVGMQDQYCTIKPDDCVGDVAFVRSDPFVFFVQPLSAKTWGGFADIPGSPDACTFPAALPFHCPRCLADENVGFWKCLSEFVPVEVHHKRCHLDDHDMVLYVSGYIPRPAISEPLRNFDGREATPEETTEYERMTVYTNQQKSEQLETYKKLFNERFFCDPSDPRVFQKPPRIYECVDGDPIKASSTSS